MNALSNVIRVIDKVFDTIEKYCTAIPLIIFTLLIFANVVGRYVLLHSITWAEELSRMLNILMVYLAISAGIKTGAHIGVDAIITLCIPKRLYRTHKVLRIIKFLITMAFCAVAAYLGFGLAAKVSAMKQVSAALRIPMFIPYIILPIGLCMTAVRCLLEIIQECIIPATPADSDDNDMLQEV